MVHNAKTNLLPTPHTKQLTVRNSKWFVLALLKRSLVELPQDFCFSHDGFLATTFFLNKDDCVGAFNISSKDHAELVCVSLPVVPVPVD